MGYTFFLVRMPWKECSVMDEGFSLWLAGEPMAELCREFGISRRGRDFGQPASERAFRTMVERRGAVLEKG
jgi:hypothetical protein